MTPKIVAVREGFVTLSNTDLTEGKGSDYPIAVSFNKLTALREGVGRYVQGTTCPIEQVPILKLERNHWWYGPVQLVEPTELDIRSWEMIESLSARRNKALDEGDKEVAEALGEAIKVLYERVCGYCPTI